MAHTTDGLGFPAPWSAQVELVEGCNRRCDFCGLWSIRDRVGDFRYQSAATATVTAAGLAILCPEARLEFAMHGEPLVHPAATDRLAHFRRVLPRAQIQVTTNGKTLAGRMQRRLDALFAAGVDYLVLDTYRPERDRLQAEAATLRDVTVVDFYRDWAPQGRSPWHNHRRRVQRTVVVMDDLGERDGEVASRVIYNHAGNNRQAAPLPAPLRKTCTLPFREVTIAWNGNVALCCHDWGHEYVCGNVHETALPLIWHGAAFTAARRLLGQRDRRFTPCARCNIGSGARSGLLPKLRPPTRADVETVRQVHRDSPATNGRAPTDDLGD